MNRRSTEARGCVVFPVGSQEWKSSNEGGMFVKLVVADNQEGLSPFGVCCGVHVYDVLTESFVGDDKRAKPGVIPNYETVADFDREQAAALTWTRHHFPHYGTQGADVLDGVEQGMSRDYLCVMVLGSTGWSGWSETRGYWTCTFEDLTEEGKALYQQVEKLYPGCDLHLLTFLDT